MIKANWGELGGISSGREVLSNVSCDSGQDSRDNG
jgi:hypothetical protein